MNKDKIIKYLEDKLKASKDSRDLGFILDKDLEFHEGTIAATLTIKEWIEKYG